MEIKHKYKFKNLSKQQVWDTIQNPEVLKAVLPGCEEFNEVGNEKYKAILKINMGPIKGEFTADVEQVNKIEPDSYRLLVKAKGKPGEIDADAKMTLKNSEDTTQLICEADAETTGLLSTIGQRMIGGVSKVILGQFFKDIEKQVELEEK